MRAWTDARQHQQLRRGKSAARQDHLAVGLDLPGLTVLDVFSPDGLVSGKQDTRDRGSGQDGEIGTRPVGQDEGTGGTASLATLLRHLGVPAAFLLRAVIVGIKRYAGLL